jgi:hypothetical protein
MQKLIRLFKLFRIRNQRKYNLDRRLLRYSIWDSNLLTQENKEWLRTFILSISGGGIVLVIFFILLLLLQNQ